MTTTTSTRSYFPALDGLRGIAILLVICCHNLNFLPNFEFGWVGVDLFFVLSGFLITDILLKTRESRNFLQNFYIRRILRIFPLYYGVVLLFFLLAPAFQSLFTQYQYYKSEQPMAWLHLQNWLYIIHQKPSDLMVMGHFWSLSVEEQFYLLWPFIVFIVLDTRYLQHIICLILSVCILSRFLCWITYGDGYTNFYFQFMSRLDGLCVGSLIAVWQFHSKEETRRNIFRLAQAVFGSQIVLFILSRTVLHNFPHFRFLGYTTIAVAFGLLVYFAIEKRTRVSRIILENPVIRYIGRISYGLYVYHWPILVLSKIFLLGMLTHLGYSAHTAYVMVSLGALALTFPVSIISYHLFERRLLALKDVMTEDGFFPRAWKRLILFFSPSSARESGS